MKNGEDSEVLVLLQSNFLAVNKSALKPCLWLWRDQGMESKNKIKEGWLTKQGEKVQNW